MKKVFILPLLIIMGACNSDDDTGASANVNNMVLTGQQVTTPSAPQNPGNYGVWFAMAGGNVYYINPSNTANPQFMLAYNMETNIFTDKTPHEEICACGYMSKIVTDGSYLYYIANEAYKYSIANDTWTEMAYPANVEDNNGEAGIVHHNGKIYFLGGREATNKFKYYDTDTDTWYNTANYLYNVETPEMAAIGNKIYALGGDEQRTRFSVYSEEDGWLALPNMPFDLQNFYATHSVAAFKDRYIFVLSNSQINIYDTQTNEWKQEPVDAQPFGYGDLFADDNNLYIASKTNDNDFKLVKITVTQE